MVANDCGGVSVRSANINVSMNLGSTDGASFTWRAVDFLADHPVVLPVDILILYLLYIRQRPNGVLLFGTLVYVDTPHLLSQVPGSERGGLHHVLGMGAEESAPVSRQRASAATTRRTTTFKTGCEWMDAAKALKESGRATIHGICFKSSSCAAYWLTRIGCRDGLP